VEGFRVEDAGGARVHRREGVGEWLRDGLADDFSGVPGDRRAPVAGRGGAHFAFESPEGRVLVRKVRRGGWLSFLGERLFSASRVFNEVRMLDAARKAGLSVPDLLGFSVRGTLIKRATVVYREIVGARTLLQDVKVGRSMISAAKAARDLHSAGILHGDLNARNILLHDGRAFLIDFDRARPCRDAGAHRRELARLFRSLAKELGTGFAPDARALLVDAYAGGPDPGLLEECERRLAGHGRWWRLLGRR